MGGAAATSARLPLALRRNNTAPSAKHGAVDTLLFSRRRAFHRVEQRPLPPQRKGFFFFKQKTAYEIGLGIPAEPLFRSTCDDKSAQIYARFDKNDWRIQPAEFYRFHDAEVNTFGYF